MKSKHWDVHSKYIEALAISVFSHKSLHWSDWLVLFGGHAFKDFPRAVFVLLKLKKKKKLHFLFSFPPTHLAVMPTKKSWFRKKSPVGFNQVYTDLSKYTEHRISTKMITVQRGSTQCPSVVLSPRWLSVIISWCYIN